MGSATGDRSSPPEGDLLWLADWRRLIAELYAEVRRIALDDPRAAAERWRSVRSALYRGHPQSPVPASEREAFEARHYPYDPGLRFEVAVDREPETGASNPAGLALDLGDAAAGQGLAMGGGAVPLIALPVSAGEPMHFERIGSLRIPFEAGERRLALFWMSGYAGGLFLPFGDTTNGTETYGAGRYVLDAAKSADLGGDATRGTLVVDFNFAYHPSCAFDPRWACPLSPPENGLDVPIRAGERL